MIFFIIFSALMLVATALTPEEWDEIFKNTRE